MTDRWVPVTLAAMMLLASPAASFAQEGEPAPLAVTVEDVTGEPDADAPEEGSAEEVADPPADVVEPADEPPAEPALEAPTETPAAPDPGPSLPVEDVLAGGAVGLGFAAAVSGLVTLMVAQRDFQRAQSAPEDRRGPLLDEGRALEVASIVSWASAGALLVGGLAALYLFRDARQRAREEALGRVRVEVGLALGGLSLRGRF